MSLETKILSYFSEHEEFRDILIELRRIIKNLPFEETLKWGIPTYVFNKKNLVGIGAFKNHVGLWFFQGALLTDQEGILHNAQEGKTKAMRQVHFKRMDEINETVLNSYLKETIENQIKGRSISINKTSSKVVLPIELESYLGENSLVNEAFKKLTKGKQREYAEYISSAKKEKTKADRLVKITPLVLKGEGINDKYKTKKKL